MKIIHFKGLQCYYANILNAAALLGVDYRPSFANLWSETEFHCDPISFVFTSKRLLDNLEVLGAKLEFADRPLNAKLPKDLALLESHPWYLFGADAFFLPWVPFYRKLHHFHYFTAKTEKDGSLCCFDPTYETAGERLLSEDILPYTRYLMPLSPVPKGSLDLGTQKEAKAILSAHPETRERLLAQIKACAYGSRQKTRLLASYIECLIDLRYFYKHYLETLPAGPHKSHGRFHKEFFHQWSAVKNGLLKLSLYPEDLDLSNHSEARNTVGRVCEYFNMVMTEEMDIAGKLLKDGNGEK